MKSKTLFKENDELVEALKANPLFSDFSSSLLSTIIPIAKIIKFKKNEPILKQGEINYRLYFLISGKLAVNVDGEFIGEMRRKGDIVGEMSVITTKPCSATVLAETPVTVLALDVRELAQLSFFSNQEFRAALYQMYSTMLAEKVKVTNIRAKRFEQTSRKLMAAQAALREINASLEEKIQLRTLELNNKAVELERSNTDLEQKNIALLTANRQLEDFFSGRDRILMRLNQLRNGQVDSLAKSLQDLSLIIVDDQEKSIVAKAIAEIGQINEVLEPITSAFFSSSDLKTSRVLLVETHRKQQIIAKMALRGTGVSLDIAEDLATAKEKLNQNSYNVLIADPAILANEEIQADIEDDTQVVLMTSHHISDWIEILKRLKGPINIVSRNENDRTFTTRNIISTVNKLANDDIFGLEKYLTWGVEVQTSKIVGSRERELLKREMVAYFAMVGLRQSLIDRALLVAEEVLMNAIYDAPVKPDGTSRYNHLPRTEHFKMPENEQGLFRYACDGMVAAISVTDPFGTLQSKTLFYYLEKRYKGDEINSDPTKGGAGRGLHQIVETSDLTVFNVKVGVSTEVIALFNLDSSTNPTRQFPLFHYFETHPKKGRLKSSEKKDLPSKGKKKAKPNQAA